MANYLQTLLNPVTTGPDSPYGVKSSREYAAELLKGSQAPVAHWAQGLGNLTKALMGGYTEYQAAEQERKGQSGATQALLAALGLNSPATTSPAPNQQTSPNMSPQFAAPPGPQFSDIPGITEAQTGQTEQMTNLPRGLRNNNPGNIIDGPFARSLPGYAGTDGKFAKFASLDDGNAAIDRLLQSYGNRGINTPNAIINRWAPPSDNNPTQTYAANVAKALGVDPNAPLDLNNPAVLSQIRGAITKQENGAVASLPQASVSAAPASAGVVPSSPAATPPINRQQLAQVLSNPWASDGVKSAVLQQLLPKDPTIQTVKEGERLVSIDRRTGKTTDITPGGVQAPNFQHTSQLRKEIADVPEYKRFSTVVPLIKDITKAAQTPGTAGDVSMLYAFAKIMDPESVVREGEYNTLTKLQSLPEQLRGNIDKYLKGEASLGPRIRQELMEAAYSRGEEFKAAAQQRLNAFQPFIQANNIKPEYVMPHFFEYPARDSLPKIYDRTQPETQKSAPAQYPNAKLAPDGNFYIPDPQRPGKYLKVTQ